MWKRHNRFAKDGTWDRVLSHLQGDADAAGDYSPALPALLAGLRVRRCGPGRPRTRPDALLGDKAYSARAHRDQLRAAKVTVVIPERADQIRNRRTKGTAGGRPVNFDAELYKGRNVVERAFNRLKHWRDLATRYDKHVLNYRGGMVLGAIILWLRPLRDTA